MQYIIYLAIMLYSTALYLYLHKKTHISLLYLYKDNVINIIASIAILWYLLRIDTNILLVLIAALIIVPLFCIILSLLRFYRIPLRRVAKEENAIVSPADGNIIYIKRVEANETPIAVKNGLAATLNEFLNTGIIDCPCWLIGINMTPFDVHKNCAPVNGRIILNKHFNGEFLSLKEPDALQRNERNTMIFDTIKGKVGIVQTASKRVRRIVTYKKENEYVKKGDWVGMIKFGSQVDILIPATCRINVQLGQQVYAKSTIIAEWKEV